MRRAALVVVAATGLACSAIAQTDQPTGPSPDLLQPGLPDQAPPQVQPGPPPQSPRQQAGPPLAPGWVPRSGADLAALDRISAKTLTLTLTIGQVARFGSLSISLRACDVRPPDQAPDATAYLDITDSKAGSPEFHGWLIRSDPAVSGLQSPVYDVQLLGCH